MLKVLFPGSSPDSLKVFPGSFPDSPKVLFPGSSPDNIILFLKQPILFSKLSWFGGGGGGGKRGGRSEC